MFIVLSRLSQGNIIVFGLLLISALFVVILRSLVPFTANFDQSTQVEAAHRLVQGLGLTTQVFALHVPDISQPPRPQYLTWWPPGGSLLSAAYLALNIPLVPALKFIGSLLTIAGWFGWAVLISPLLSKPVLLGSISLPLHYAMAISLPLFYTPTWTGTDLLLWAGLPFIIQLVLQSGEQTGVRSQRSFLWIGIAGFLLGLIYSFRYASLFIIATAFLMLCQMHWLKLGTILKKILMFIASSLIIIIPVTIYDRFADMAKLNDAKEIGLISTVQSSVFALYSGEVPTFNQYIQSLSNNLSGISSIFGMTNLYIAFNGKSDSYIIQFINLLSGILLAIFVVILPVILVRIKMISELQSSRSPFQKQKRNSHYLALSLSFIPISLVALLAATMSRYSYPFLRDTRYYIPAIIPTILISYYVATLDQSNFRKIKPLRMLFVLITLVFLLYNTIYRPIGSVLLHKATSLIQEPLLATSEVTFFSHKFITGFEKTKQALIDLHRTYPQAVMYAPQAQLVYDAPAWLRVSMAEGDFWQTAHTSQPVRLIMTTFDICSWRCVPPNVLERLAQQPGFQTVQVFPDELTRIIMVELPAGYRFTSQSAS